MAELGTSTGDVAKEFDSAASTSVDVGKVDRLHKKQNATGESETVEEMKSELHQANKKGYREGGIVRPNSKRKSDDGADHKYMLTSMTATNCNLEECTFDGPPQKIVVSITELVKEFNVYEGRVQTKVPRFDSVLKSDEWNDLYVVSSIHIAIKTKTEEVGTFHDSLQLFHSPYGVRPCKPFKKEELRLVAACMNVSKKSSPMSIGVGYFAEAKSPYYINGTIQLPVKNDGTLRKSYWMVPAWFVAVVKDEKERNMKIIWESVKVGNLDVPVPILVNTRQVQANEELKRFHSGTDTPAPPAAKKQRT